MVPPGIEFETNDLLETFTEEWKLLEDNLLINANSFGIVCSEITIFSVSTNFWPYSAIVLGVLKQNYVIKKKQFSNWKTNSIFAQISMWFLIIVIESLNWIHWGQICGVFSEMFRLWPLYYLLTLHSLPFVAYVVAASNNVCEQTHSTWTLFALIWWIHLLQCISSSTKL